MNRHGVIDKPDPHRAEEVEHLKSRVDLDNEIEEIKKRQEQQVIMAYKIQGVFSNWPSPFSVHKR